MGKFQVVVTCVFSSDEAGNFQQTPEEMAQQIVDAFLAKDPKLWSFTYPVEVVETKPKDPRWWLGKELPFVAHSSPNMEHCIVTFATSISTTPSYRVVNYPMNVTKISTSGLRFKVNDVPEMWVMAYQTQENPE
jgi:hypothetical protein